MHAWLLRTGVFALARRLSSIDAMSSAGGEKLLRALNRITDAADAVSNLLPESNQIFVWTLHRTIPRNAPLVCQQRRKFHSRLPLQRPYLCRPCVDCSFVGTFAWDLLADAPGHQPCLALGWIAIPSHWSRNNRALFRFRHTWPAIVSDDSIAIVRLRHVNHPVRARLFDALRNLTYGS